MKVASFETCPICMNDMTEYICQLPCKHSFHSPCILYWAAQNKSTCPICRQEMFNNKNIRDESLPNQTDSGAGILNQSDYETRTSNLVQNHEYISQYVSNLRLQHYNIDHLIQNTHVQRDLIDENMRQQLRRERLFRARTNTNNRDPNRSHVNIVSLLFRKVMVVFSQHV